ncbi:MAG: DUF309 domain-containing protein [Caldilineaceae bacterium]|nr:DUF309 domain-containing protein [Anaerolineae bacterium]MCB0057878.1 DUF309 domain-containing protein [Caldilineaceae bacterium]
MAKAVIVITGNPAWRKNAAEIIESADYTVVQQTESAGYVTRLVDVRAVLLLVDGDAADWGFWTATPKASPATRRIPIILVSDNPERRAGASAAGADFAITANRLASELPTLLQEMARVPDAAFVTQLDCQCNEPMPPEGLKSIALFNAGEYYKQHDQFEAMWMAESGPVRELYRAILQVGIAYYQITRGNHRGALKMLLRSVQWLALLPDVCRGVDVAQLRQDAAAVRAELERVGDQGMDKFERSLLKPVHMADK